MHKYMRAIGFSRFENRKQLQKLLTDVVVNSENMGVTLTGEETLLGEFSKDFADHLGIAVCGDFDEEEKFVYEYYYPYIRGTGITSGEDISVERHADKYSYAGVLEEMKVGITLIFYLQNKISYVKAEATDCLPVAGTTVTLSALSTSGCIMMPILKDEEQISRVKQRSVKRCKLMDEARKGSEEAIETLTLEDMDMYSVVNNRIQREDLFSIVDTFFMPYGVECDHYSVMGEILAVKKVQNRITDEEIYILTINCNELTFDIAINIMDLLGEPQVGRRFKGIIWLQGFINFPDENLSL